MGTQPLWSMQHPPECTVARYNGTESLICTVPSTGEFGYDEWNTSLRSPHKRVSVGTDFQAELPKLVSPNSKDDNEQVDESDDLRWISERTWARHEDDDDALNESSRNLYKLSCSCASQGTFECVRLHIEEKRKVLQEELGDAFFLWRFDEMGEIVSEHWSSEDEEAFHDLVRRNPVSFWHKVLDVFPSKSMPDIVSYYFNVFVLRKRAIQNRTDPENIDSDDDSEMINENNEDGYNFVGPDEEESQIESQVDSQDDSQANSHEDSEVNSHEECQEESQIESQVDDAIYEDDEEAGCISWAVKDAGHEEEIQDRSLFVVDAAGPTEILAAPSLRDAYVHEHTKPDPNICSQGGSNQSIKQWETLSWGQTNHEWIKEPWNSPTTRDDVDKLISTNGLIEEIFGAEGWER